MCLKSVGGACPAALCWSDLQVKATSVNEGQTVCHVTGSWGRGLLIHNNRK